MNLSQIILTDVCQILTQYLADFDKEKFEENLDSFIESAINRDDYSFETGLLGAGWFISFFHKHKIMEGDIDEILSDFDDSFYKLAIKAFVDSETSVEEMLRFIHYFQGRIQNKPIKHNFYRRFALFEIIKLLTDKLCTMLKSSTLTRYEEVEVLLKLSYLSQTCICEKEIEEVLYAKTEGLIESFKDQVMWSVSDQFYLQLLQLSCIQYNNPYWVNEIENIIYHMGERYKSDLMISNLKKLNRLLFEDPNYIIDLSNFSYHQKDILLILLVINVVKISL